MPVLIEICYVLGVECRWRELHGSAAWEAILTRCLSGRRQVITKKGGKMRISDIRGNTGLEGVYYF
ncbi:hypothetical protein CVT26_013924 [Gymnopilus dilepis]|uniref:Uncharacterized protein n=1 Tax=Gymnopilus dilepis TaxID=231916 RepID=A0A409WT60_9AGAR|nr:hypothetical protein CVT26_013924 [Gymnopilus dilepis]